MWTQRTARVPRLDPPPAWDRLVVRVPRRGVLRWRRKPPNADPMPRTEQTDPGDPIVSQATPTQQARRAPEQVIEELRRLRAEIRADNPDLTDEDWDALADRLGAEVKAGLAQRVRASRKDTD